MHVNLAKCHMVTYCNVQYNAIQILHGDWPAQCRDQSHFVFQRCLESRRQRERNGRESTTSRRDIPEWHERGDVNTLQCVLSSPTTLAITGALYSIWPLLLSTCLHSSYAPLFPSHHLSPSSLTSHPTSDSLTLSPHCTPLTPFFILSHPLAPLHTLSLNSHSLAPLHTFSHSLAPPHTLSNNLTPFYTSCLPFYFSSPLLPPTLPQLTW